MTVLAPAPHPEVADTAPPAAPARVAAVLAVLVALVGALLGPTGQLDQLLGGGPIAVRAGVVERQVADGWAAVPPGVQVAAGDVLRAPDGPATLQVPGGSIDLADGTQVTVGQTFVVAAGSVVVQSPQVSAGSGGAVGVGPGAWRWDATGRVGAYAGSVVVTDAADRETLVRSLQQGRVRDAVVTEDSRPYVYTDADPFDRQHLRAAFGVDDYVSALRGGLEADYGTQPQPAAFYTDFDGLDGQLVIALGDVGFDRAGPRFGPPADVLVASVVTDALVTNAGMAPQDAADEVRTLRLAGATWGLIAQGRDLDADHVRAAAERALTLRQLAEEQGTAEPPVTAPTPGTTTATPATGDGEGSGDVDSPGAGTDGGPTTAPTDGDPPAPSSPPQDDPGPVESVVEDTGVGDLVGGEVGGLVDDVVRAGDDLLDGPDPDDDGRAPSRQDQDGGGLLDTTGDVVGGTVDTVEGAVGSVLGN